MMSVIPIVALLALAIGLTLALIGWRGRRVDDHPVCRKCRFDLAGVYPANETCPECGRDLAGRRAVRIGNRRHKRLPLGVDRCHTQDVPEGRLTLLLRGPTGSEVRPRARRLVREARNERERVCVYRSRGLRPTTPACRMFENRHNVHQNFAVCPPSVHYGNSKLACDYLLRLTDLRWTNAGTFKI